MARSWLSFILCCLETLVFFCSSDNFFSSCLGSPESFLFSAYSYLSIHVCVSVWDDAVALKNYRNFLRHCCYKLEIWVMLVYKAHSGLAGGSWGNVWNSGAEAPGHIQAGLADLGETKIHTQRKCLTKLLGFLWLFFTAGKHKSGWTSQSYHSVRVLTSWGRVLFESRRTPLYG